MSKYLVTVILEFVEGVEADTAADAEDFVRNLTWDDIPKDISIDVEPIES